MQSHHQPPLSRLLTTAAVIVVVAAMYLAKGLLVPFALGIFFATILAPLATLLERLRLHRVAAVVIVITLACGLLAFITWIIAGQGTQLLVMLPEYKANIVEKFNAFRGSALEKASDAVREISSELGGASRPTAATQIVQPSSGPFDFVGGAAEYLGNAAVVIVITLFILLEREDLRDRVVHLLGDGHVNVTMRAIEETSSRVSRVLLMQTIINSIHGTAVGIGLFFLDVPNAALWGLLSAVLRFIPYLGPLVAAAMPLLLSLAVFNGWSQPLMVLGFFLVLELISNNVLEPWLYGVSAGASSFAIIAMAVFWTWMWGPIGLLLATPLTVCMVVMGKYVPQLRFLSVLFSDRPEVPQEVSLNLRLVAMDLKGAREIVQRALKETRSLTKVYDTIVLPALALVVQERQRGTFDEVQGAFVHQLAHELIEELGESARQLEVVPGAPQAGSAANDQKLKVVALCMPARDFADEIAATMLAQVLQLAGLDAQVSSVDSLASEKAFEVDKLGADLVCISALPPIPRMRARYLAKRLRARFADLNLFVGLWMDPEDPNEELERLRIPGPCTVVKSLADAEAAIVKLAQTIAYAKNAPQAPEVGATSA